MALVYFDSSALVKLLVDEDGSDVASDLWDGCDAALSSRLAYPEVHAALSASHRNSDLTRRELLAAQATWEEFWTAMWPVELTVDVEHRAGELAHSRALRGADAVHLASALGIGRFDTVVAVWDRRLHAGAVAEGFAVAPLDLDR